MSTRSTITVRLTDGTFKSVYCHWDGYEEPPGVGSMLRIHYNTQELAEEVVSLGSLSALGADLEHSTAYGRDRGETEGVSPGIGVTPEAAIRNTGYGPQQFNYLWTGAGWERI